jgi:hypothetical protein
MNPDADTSDLFPGFSPVPQMVFVNDSVSLQTEADQRVILVHGVVYSHYSGRIARPKPMPWFRCTNPDTSIRTIWRARSVTPREPCAASSSACTQED